MFDNDTGWLGKSPNTLKCSISIRHVVKRQGLALQLGGAGNTARTGGRRHIKCRRLVRVLAVAHLLLATEM